MSTIRAEIEEEIKAGNRICPFCNAGLQRLSGCSYVICQECQQPFCFNCGTEMPTGRDTCTEHSCDSEIFKAIMIGHRLATKRRNIKSTNSGDIRITVETPTGDYLAIQIGSKESIAALKTKIQAKCGMAPAEQRLRFKGKPLSDNETVSNCGLRAASNIILVREVQGGYLTIF